MMNPGEPRAPEPSAGLTVGDVVAGRYRIDAVLGEGGMGIVYRAEHLHLRKPHALKILLPAFSSMPEVVARFEREAVAAGNIQSPHVVAATDFGRLPDGSFFLVMEYVNGRTLRAFLEAGALDTTRALHVLRGIVAALRAAHAMGVVHRDLKPENIMLVARGGDPDFVKVLDFGSAKVEGREAGRQGSTSNALTCAGTVIGTPDYMSPEQASGQAVDARSDLYSVGVLLFEMLTGRCPFGGGVVTVLRQHMTADVPDLPAAVTASVDPRIVALLRRLLAKLPEDRFASTTELMDAIDECSNERDVSALPAPVRPSLESVRGMATPIAQRVRRSVLAGFKAIEDAGRFPLHDPKVLLRHATPERLMLGAVAVAAIATMIAVRAAGGRTHVATSATAPMSTTSAAVVVPIPRLSDPPLSTDAGAQPSGSSPLQSAPSRGHRRTGPGGIYIPPPNQWFKR